MPPSLARSARNEKSEHGLALVDYLVICLVALFASGLTFFSGFGLGTLLTPAFVLFFPVEIAIAMTAVVHFSNNVFKLYLIGRAARRDVVLRFGLPAILAAFAGAWVLTRLAGLAPIARHELLGRQLVIEPIKLVVAVLMAVFAVWEVAPRVRDWRLGPRWLPIGGVLSGFFGGLSGHQGAFRSVFLLQSGLTKEAFIATGVVIAMLIDVSRLTIYARHWGDIDWVQSGPLIAAAIAAAFTGALAGRWLLPMITLNVVRWVVAALLLLIAVLLAGGAI
jgi:uncharacterized membrane protein YfcA